MTAPLPTASLPQHLLCSTSLIPSATVGSLGSLSTWSPLLRFPSLYLSMAHSLVCLKALLKCHFTRKSFMDGSMQKSKLHSQDPRSPFPLYFSSQPYYFQIYYTVISISVLPFLNISSMKAGMLPHLFIPRTQNSA